mgnify:FL=1
MDFKMNAVIHKGQDYEKSLHTFQNKRMEYIEYELRAFDSQPLFCFLNDLRKRGRTMEEITGIAV